MGSTPAPAAASPQGEAAQDGRAHGDAAGSRSARAARNVSSSFAPTGLLK